MWSHRRESSQTVSKAELPMLSQPHHPTVILGHLITSPPQSPQPDASPPAQSHYCNAVRTPRAQVGCVSSSLTSKGCPQSPWHTTHITTHFDVTVLSQPIRFYLLDLVKIGVFNLPLILQHPWYLSGLSSIYYSLFIWLICRRLIFLNSRFTRPLKLHWPSWSLSLSRCSDCLVCHFYLFLICG